MVSGSLPLYAADQRLTAAFASSAGPAKAAVGGINNSATKTSVAFAPLFPPVYRRRTAEKRYELAPFHCPMPPVLQTERIAHLSYGRRLLRCGISIPAMT